MHLILPLFIFCSFISENGKTIIFRAASNDMADVTLSLNQSHQLNLLFKPLEENIKYTFQGRWEQKNNYYELTFLRGKTGDPDLKTLFSDSRERVMIINNNQVKFLETESRIKIWGIICVKQ